jgi:L-lactate dehydrogenase complex protein LldE
VSCRMGLDRLADHRAAGADVIASTDISCLLHLDGLAQKKGYDFRAMHVAEILASSLREAAASGMGNEDGAANGPR